jgi:hypothetical protein
MYGSARQASIGDLETAPEILSLISAAWSYGPARNLKRPSPDSPGNQI